MRKKSDILDGLLVIDFRNGNKKAMALLVKRWHSKFCRQAFWYTQNMDDAKDIVQD
ncbi:MAG: RNA polymerase sigma factor, partial [Flavobacteriaceae bacterium]|nr:RNA polymerase sigma factor [Flavobacteriaceae bacterium]